jgi:OOP family OmpA-OmpF porin
MSDHPEIHFVRVEGHTDSVGSAECNKKLFAQRAQSVVKWLTARGVAADHLSGVGMGKEKPLVPNDTQTAPSTAGSSSTSKTKLRRARKS